MQDAPVDSLLWLIALLPASWACSERILPNLAPLRASADRIHALRGG